MRGTFRGTYEKWLVGGIIPAYAGNIGDKRRADGAQWDHPRVCGEHFLHLAQRLIFRGSSPRMRGTFLQGFIHIAGTGIIPAYAGNM